MPNREVCIFPYINISQILKMDDFEIHPLASYDLSLELAWDEVGNLNIFADSFRETFFKAWESPKKMEWIWILRYNWSIIIDSNDIEPIHDNLKILFLLLKLHISHDFFNPWMNNINVKSFDIFWFNVWNNLTNKFGHMSECKDLFSTVPENMNWLWNTKFFPIAFCTNNIPVEFKMFWWWDRVFGVESDIIDVTTIFQWISSNSEYYSKFLNIASVHFWLEQQSDLFFYYSIIPSIIEVLLQLDVNDKKKLEAVKFWKLLDDAIIENNDRIEIISHTKTDWTQIIEELWIIARTFVLIYDLRNLLLHEWKKSFKKLKVDIHGVEVKIYDIFQLIFKYAILYDFIEKWIIENTFIKVKITWSPLASLLSWEEVKIEYFWNKLLALDQELDWLIRKSESDRDIALSQ